MRTEKLRLELGARLVCTTWIACSLVAAGLGAVVLDSENSIDIPMKDGFTVRLYREAKFGSGSAIPNQPMPDLQALGARARRGDVGDRGQIEKAYSALGLKPRSVKVTAAKHTVVEQLSRVYPKPKTTSNYYYLPANLHLAERPDGTPEFLFLKFTTEERAAAGGASGAIMHFLMSWGLSTAQEAELRSKLKRHDPGGRLMGAVPLEPAGESATFRVISATLSDGSMAPTVVTSGKAPLVPGGKVAVASRLTSTGAQLLAATFEQARSITDVSLELDFSYQLLTPAARGTVVFDWEKLVAESEKFSAESEYSEEGGDCLPVILWVVCEDETATQSYAEMQEHFKFLEEKKIMTLQFDELIQDERVEKLREAFFQYFLDKMAEPVAPPPIPEAGDSGTAGPQAPSDLDGHSYRFSREKVFAALESRYESFSMEARFSVRHPWTVTGNLASWYDHVRDNPKCVASVNLNDPFFQHRDIHFVLDLDAKEMFEEAVNYVTVNVRKQRSAGHDFEDHVTIDAKYLGEQGISASLTYARADDDSPDIYEYQTQWSLKGGHVYPERPRWTRGRWEGVTLIPPVVPRTIEVEGSLEDMFASDITRITVQVHYPKFGKEVEENIHLSPGQGESLVARRVFMDRSARGYAYRLVVNHKTKGKLVLPWTARVGDDYIYAAIPPELLENGSSINEAAKEAAGELVHSAKEKVLEQFQELLDKGVGR